MEDVSVGGHEGGGGAGYGGEGSSSRRAGGGVGTEAIKRANRRKLLDSEEEDEDEPLLAAASRKGNGDSCVARRNKRVVAESDEEVLDPIMGVRRAGEGKEDTGKGKQRAGDEKEGRGETATGKVAGKGKGNVEEGSSSEGGGEVVERRRVSLSAARKKRLRPLSDSDDAQSEGDGAPRTPALRDGPSQASTPRSGEYSFRDRKKSRVGGVGEEVGEAWKQHLKNRNKAILKGKDEEEDYDIGVGKAGSKDDPLILGSGEEESDMEDFIVPDSDDSGGYDEAWKREAIMHDDYDDLREAPASARKHSSPRKRLGDKSPAAGGQGGGRWEGDTPLPGRGSGGKNQSKLVLKRDPAMVAVEAGDVKALKALLQQDPKRLQHKDPGRSRQKPLLHAAVEAGQLECIPLNSKP